MKYSRGCVCTPSKDDIKMIQDVRKLIFLFTRISNFLALQMCISKHDDIYLFYLLIPVFITQHIYYSFFLVIDFYLLLLFIRMFACFTLLNIISECLIGFHWPEYSLAGIQLPACRMCDIVDKCDQYYNNLVRSSTCHLN